MSLSSRSPILRGGAVDAWRPAPAGEGKPARRGGGVYPREAVGRAGVRRGAAAGAGGVPAGAEEAARRVAALEARLASLEAERDGLRSRVAELEREVAAAREQGLAVEEAWRRAAVDLAVAVARRLLRRELALHPEEVVRLAAEVLGAAAPAARNLRLAASPGDAERLAEERERLTARLAPGAELEIVPDERLSHGDLVLESPAGTWDARMETGLAELAEAARAAVAAGAGDGSAASAGLGDGSAAVAGLGAGGARGTGGGGGA